MATTQSLSHAPEYVTHREGVTAPDAAPSLLTDQKQGINSAAYLSALVQVIPTGGANPSVQILTWSDAAGKFIVQNPDLVRTGAGADVPYEFQFECRSRRFFVRVTAIAAGSCDVYVAGHELDHAR